MRRRLHPGKTVTFGTLVLGGASAGNYSVKGDSQTTTTANISKETVTVSGIVAADKTYDGETDATIDPSGAVFAGKYAGDTLTVSTTGTFADADAGIGKTVTFGTLVLGGADVGNYQLGILGNQATTTATIHQREVTVSGIGAMDMVYNGTTLTGTDLTSVSFANKLSGDTLTITATANFTDENVGTGKTVNLTGLTLGGADVANYALPGGKVTLEHTADGNRNRARLLGNDHGNRIGVFADADARAVAHAEIPAQIDVCGHRQHASGARDAPVLHDNGSVMKRCFGIKYVFKQLA